MSCNKLNFKLLNLLIILISGYIIISTSNWWLKIIERVLSIILPFIIAFAISYAVYPLVKKLTNKGINKHLAVSLIVIVISCFSFGLIVMVIPLVYEQLLTLVKLIIEVVSRTSNRFQIDLGEFEDSIINVLNNFVNIIGNYISTGTISLVGKSVDFVSKFIVIYIVSIYFLSGMDNIRERFKNALKNKSEKLFNYIQVVDRELCNYLWGFVLFIIIQFFEYSILFFIVGHPNWLLLGILASITTIIPYFGGIITNIIAVILASAVSTKVFIATTIICLVFPNIDSYVISPKVYGKTNSINPLWTIFWVFALSNLFGFFGIVVALPVYIVINTTYHYFKKDIKTNFNKLTK